MQEGQVDDFDRSGIMHPHRRRQVTILVVLGGAEMRDGPLMAAVAMLVFWKYPLTDKFFSQIRDENEARKLELAAKGQQLY